MKVGDKYIRIKDRVPQMFSTVEITEIHKNGISYKGLEICGGIRADSLYIITAFQSFDYFFDAYVEATPLLLAIYSD